MSHKKACAVIAAAGSGTRMGGVSKPNMKLLGKTLFEYVIGAFDDSFVEEIVVVCSEDNENSLRELSEGVKTPVKFIRGGATRAESVFKGISAASEEAEIICAHDCARPFITKQIIEDTINATEKTGAACVCSAVTDTLKFQNPDGKITTPDRNRLFAVQTPQCFEKDLYFRACQANGDISVFTDETSLLESIGIEVNYIKRSETNMKLTAPDDVPIAEILMKRKVSEND